MKKSSMLTSSKPTLIPDLRQMSTILSGTPLREAKAALELATVLIRMPNQATPYEPSIPRIEATRMIKTLLIPMPWSPTK
ncbi:MAG: hypothetical protein A4E66_01456 [Syntrophus sp. PtaB.Bin001]|nr:MAG: hypothetical protein A4E66_01456 [Syntrophus sp. PtaB.Bin001]